MFDTVTRARLQRLITSPPQNKDDWYPIWHMIIVQLFPISRNYAYGPLHRIAKDQRHTPYLAYEVSEFIAFPATRRSVLIVVIMESSDWRACVPSLEKEINRLTNAALSGTLSERVVATSKVFTRDDGHLEDVGVTSQFCNQSWYNRRLFLLRKKESTLFYCRR